MTNPQKEKFSYQLHIDSIDYRRPIDPARFTLNSFVSDLQNVKVYDRETQKTTYLNITALENTKDLSDIADKVRQRGFAAPKP